MRGTTGKFQALKHIWDEFLKFEPITIGVVIALPFALFAANNRLVALATLGLAVIAMIANCVGNWTRGNTWKSGWLRVESRLDLTIPSRVLIAGYDSQGAVSVEICLNILAEKCHIANINWWRDVETGRPIERNVGELLMLCVSELAEALEGDRKNLMDDKLPHRKMFDVELADCLIRIFDLAGGMGIDLTVVFAEKMNYNAQRADHKIENRKLPGGKVY